MHGSDMNDRKKSAIIMAKTVTSSKQFWVLIAGDQSTVLRRWKSLNTNGHCAQTNRQKNVVDTPK